MKELDLFLALLAVLTPSRAVPINSSLTRRSGLCEYVRQNSPNVTGGFVPQCDAYGNFLPLQCSGSTGYCWCVDVITGAEIPNTRTPPGVIPVDCNKDVYCPKGWSRFGKRCFIFISSPKPWPEAEGYCLFEEANLASIHSYDENHFLQDLTRGDTHDFPETWIGGHDAIYPCFWMWSDGTKFDYENFLWDYEMERTERCLKMNCGYDWRWSYASCNESLPFVCAKKIWSQN